MFKILQAGALNTNSLSIRKFEDVSVDEWESG